jgi:hypothetical protein
MGMRTIGVTVVAGIFLATLRRRAYRQAILFGVVAAFVVASEFWPTIIHRAVSPALGGSNPLEPGWNQVLAYYTNYFDYAWRMGVPTIWAFLSMVKLNFLLLISSPGYTVAGPATKWVSAFTAVLSVPIILGISRQRQYPYWGPIFYVLSCYCAVLLIWPCQQPERFLLPFLPLLFAGLWLEMRRLGKILLVNLRGQTPMAQRVAATGITAALLSLFVFIGWKYLVSDPRSLTLAAESRQHALEEREQAYDWIREHTNSDARIASYNDGVLYLYTGRQGMRPLMSLPTVGYLSDEKSLMRDVAHVTDAAQHVGVRYWVTTSDDFDLEVGRELINARIAEIMSGLPLVFSSRENSVQIHDASCLFKTQRSECHGAGFVLDGSAIARKHIEFSDLSWTEF